MSAADAGPHSARILILDDDDQVRDMLCIALEVAGFEPIEAETAAEAYRRLACSRLPDALVIDLVDAEHHGLEVLRYVRAHSILQQLPIVFLAAHTDADLEWRAQMSGADAIFLKPLSMRVLQQTIAELVRQGRPTALRH